LATERKGQAQNKSVQTTRWFAIWVLFLCGCTVAAHIGKAPPALPLIRNELALSLVQVGSIVSSYAIFVAASGLLLGILVALFGYVRFAIVGVALGGIGSLLGAFAHTLPVMLLSRAIEGGGWIFAAIALPALLSVLGTERDRPLIMGLWGAFVPVGAGSMLLVAPVLQSAGGWRLSWLCAGGLSVVATLIVARLCFVHRDDLAPLAAASRRPPLVDLRRPAIFMASLCFFFYSFPFLAVTSFLPTLLIERTQISLEVASRLAAGVVLVNAIGNIAAGWLLRHGFARHRVLAVAALLSGITAWVVYTDGMPLFLRLVAAVLFSIVGGLVPGTLFATVPLIASVPASVGVLIGLMLQSSGVGQWLGPLALPLVVERFGSWSAAGVLMLLAGCGGALAAQGLRGVDNQ